MSATKVRFVDYKVIKASVSIVQILERYQLLPSLRRLNDDQFTGTCPIHRGENKTAFRVSVSKNCWNCFSKCQCGGNILDFVAKMEGISLHLAAVRIAEWFRIEEAFTPASAEREIAPVRSDRSEVQRPAVAPAPAATRSVSLVEDESVTENKPLAFVLKNMDAAHPYLQQRGLSAETIQTFGLGFCQKGVMQNHVTIPIHNGSGQLVAYAGRWPGEPPDPDRKYKLPKGFRKSLEVFNLHRAMQTDASQPLIVVEGFFDCMKLWQAGVQRVVAVMGSHVSDAQEAAIVQAVAISRKVVLLFDEDKAGREGRTQALARLASRAYVRVILLDKEGLQPEALSPEQVQELALHDSALPYRIEQPKFSPGQLVATPNALNCIPPDEIIAALTRHLRGDWGEVCAEDKRANNAALAKGGRLLSVYRSKRDIKFWLITEADRSVTTVLLPEDY